MYESSPGWTVRSRSTGNPSSNARCNAHEESFPPENNETHAAVSAVSVVTLLVREPD
ncbi:MAG: hypothetical protein J07HB67_02796 [halophilic archaeon J07HB67]|jgi:hypothetical protein|nr:MAG: hypothetical protein J07HB67_02796 [halophilic archaeon J07HB67]